MNIAAIVELAPVFAVCLCLAMLVLLEVGRRIGIRRVAADPGGARAGVGAVEGAVFGLLGLLIAFSFSGAAARFDARRMQIVEETNDIGTAYLRIDLLPAEAQPGMRELFRTYLDSRIATYRKLPDLSAAKQEYARSVELQGEIWSRAVAATREAGNPAVMTLLLSALNQMIDITTTRTATMKMHPPPVIIAMLAALALINALLAGYGMAGGKRRSWIHILGFAVIMTLTVYVILDLEFPRLGVIRLDSFDQLLVDLRQSMK